MKQVLVVWVAFLLAELFTLPVLAGGSGYNVAIIVNQNSTNSVQLGNYYRAARNVPPENYLRINWTGSSIDWQLSDFTNTLLNPFLAMLSSRQLTNQIDYVVLSMDIPYRIDNGTNGVNSTTSALFYGFKNDPNGTTLCELTAGSSNQYAGSESIFRSTLPNSSSSNYWLVTMLTLTNLAIPEQIVSQGIASDGTFPTNTVWLNKDATDPDRNVRYTEFDSTVFDARLGGVSSIMRTNLSYGYYFSSQILGVMGGSAYYDIPTNSFVPGAMADSLTSFSGQIFENPGQDTMIKFLVAGAAGSYGTITEPCNFQEKFPSSQNYFYQSRGFSLGESYYQSVTNPYQGLIVGEPLTAPFAQPGTGSWTGISSNSILSGTTNLAFQFIASSAQRPIQRVDLFLDGLWLETVTNIPPQSGDVLNVSLKGFQTSYTVPTNATIKSVTSNLVNTLNGGVYQNNTKVSATVHGDRIELHSTASYTVTGSQIAVSVSSTNSSKPPTTFINSSKASPGNFLDSTAQGIGNYMLAGPGSVSTNATLTVTVTKTNNSVVSFIVTNTISSATVTQFAQQLLNAINNAASLQGSDGLLAEDLQTDPSNGDAYFNLQPISAGYAAAQIKVMIAPSSGISISPPGANTLTQNLGDLEPRENFFITAGMTNLSAIVAFNTATQADGYHELAAVAYEGSHVRTQTRATQNIIIQNTPLSATLSPLLTGTNSSLQPTFQITVAASPTNNINTIQLFSTGGLLAATTNQSSAIFPIALSTLDIGVHPFYAIVSDNSGHQYRTPTQNIGLMGVGYAGTNLFGVDYPFNLQVSGPAPTFVWPATAGRTYYILSTTNLSTTPFQLETTVVPSSSLGSWTETNALAAQQFYRVSVTP